MSSERAELLAEQYGLPLWQIGATAMPEEARLKPNPVDTLIACGFEETAKAKYYGRRITGPFVGDFKSELEVFSDLVADIDPALTPQYLASSMYYTDAMRFTLRRVEGGEYGGVASSLDYLRREREVAMNKLASGVIMPAIKLQTVADGLLAQPSFLVQGDRVATRFGTQAIEARQGCANACFRMVCGDILGQPIAHQTVVDQLKRSFLDHKIENHEYLNFFHSEAMAEASGKKIDTIDILGADLSIVAAIASKAGEKWPDSKTYCIVPLGSETARSIVHQGVLLWADSDNVCYHDPSDKHGQASRIIPKEDFVRRWSLGLNQAMIVIAR